LSFVYGYFKILIGFNKTYNISESDLSYEPLRLPESFSVLSPDELTVSDCDQLWVKKISSFLFIIFVYTMYLCCRWRDRAGIKLN
jgi:hypothetical protein